MTLFISLLTFDDLSLVGLCRDRGNSYEQGASFSYSKGPETSGKTPIRPRHHPWASQHARIVDRKIPWDSCLDPRRMTCFFSYHFPFMELAQGRHRTRYRLTCGLALPYDHVTICMAFAQNLFWAKTALLPRICQ